MKISHLALTLLTLPLAHSTVARADLSQSGGVGLILNPTAELPQRAQVALAYEDLGDIDILGATVSNLKFYRLHGAIPIGSRLEISGGVAKLRASDRFNGGFDGLSRSGAIAGAKLLVAGNARSGFQLAIGAGSNRALYRNVHTYIVASVALAPGLSAASARGTAIRLHLGVRRDRFSTQDVGGPKSNKTSVFGGAEVPLTPQTALIGEVGSKNNELGREKSPYAVGVRYSRSQSLSFSAGVQRQGVLQDSGLFVRTGYNF